MIKAAIAGGLILLFATFLWFLKVDFTIDWEVDEDDRD